MTRQVWVRNAPASVRALWPEARQVAFLRIQWEQRRPEAKPRKTEVHHYIVTGPAGRRRLAAARVAALIRGHWGIENRHFHVKDRTLREDDQHARTGALMLACMRSVAATVLQSISLTGRRRSYLPEKRLILRSRPPKALRLVLNPLF